MFYSFFFHLSLLARPIAKYAPPKLRKEIPITHVSIGTNEKLRESRLIKNIWSYIGRSVATILRIYLMYEPLKTFFSIGLFFIIPGSFLVIRFLYFYLTSGRSGYVQSLVIAAVMIIMGLGTMLLGLLGDVISANRKISEEMLYRCKKNTFERNM